MAIFIVIAGAVCIPFLPIAQYPEIAPPVVQVSASYTGASAEVVEESVTTPIEQQINGVQGMTYMNSYSSSDGSSTINVTFDIGYDLAIAAVDTQNYASIALPQVPEDVRRYGVTVRKQATSFIMVINLLSPGGEQDELFLSNYATINIVPELQRIYGVGNVSIFGERRYSMRLWLDPDKLAATGLTSDDVVNAVQEQNVQVAAGGIGLPPTPQDQAFSYTIQTKGRLASVKEFEDIIVRTADDGAIVRVKDLARVELGAENYRTFSRLNGHNTTSIGIYQLPGANAVDIAEKSRATIERLSKRFPKGMEYRIAYDTTIFVEESIKEVLKTLIEAIILVFLVIYIFLQDWRSTIPPAIEIPVSLVGTFAVMAAFGFSINTLTLFGLVLAIGLVVDDSIVVVENVSRIMAEEHLRPIEATKKAMAEIVGPIIAITLVLMAVFIPVAFVPGISGQLYRQFALTIAIAMGLSALNALTLSPALRAIIMREETGEHGAFFRAFNRGYGAFAKYFEKVNAFCLKQWRGVLVAFAAMLAVTGLLFHIVPTGFVPEEDQGYFFLVAQGPEGTSLVRSDAIASRMEKELMEIEGVADVLTIGGFNLINSTPDTASNTFILILKPWDERKTEELSVQGLIMTTWLKMRKHPEIVAMPFNAPPIQGLSTTGGFRFVLEDYEGGALEELNNVAQRLIEAAKDRPELGDLSTSFKVDYPQIYADIDRTKAKTMGISLNSIFNALQAELGSVYVNDFNKFGRVYRVFLQADKGFRAKKSDIGNLYVKNSAGDMVPLSGLVQVHEFRGAQTVSHYNIYRSVEIDGSPAPGYSSNQAMNAMEELASKVLPSGYGFEWTGTAYQEKKSAGMAPYIFALAIVFVFLFLAAQYESWSMPFMVILSVPLAILGALAAVWLRGLVNDVFCQVGLVMLIGLASKNAILIVEFAKVLREGGASIIEAAETAVRIRLRPIIMTSLAFIMGILPLVFATGASSASRHALGTAVLGGMIASTFLSLVIVPVFYVVIENIREHGFATAVEKFSPAMRWATDIRGSLTWLYRELSGAVKEMHELAQEKVKKPLEELTQELSIDESNQPEEDGKPPKK